MHGQVSPQYGPVIVSGPEPRFEHEGYRPVPNGIHVEFDAGSKWRSSEA